MKQLKLLIILIPFLLQGCGGYRISEQGAQTAQSGFENFSRVKETKYGAQARIAEAFAKLEDHKRAEGMAAGIDFDQVSKLSATGQAAFMENYFQTMRETKQFESYAAVALAAHGKTSESEVIRQAMDPTNESSRQWGKTVRKGLSVVSLGFGLREGRRAIEAFADRTAANVIAKDGSTINYNNEQFDYRPTAKDGSTINGGDYKPNNAGGIPVNPLTINDTAFVEGRPSPECPPTHPVLRPDGLCSDGNGGEVTPTIPGITPEPDPVFDVEN